MASLFRTLTAISARAVAPPVIHHAALPPLIQVTPLLMKSPPPRLYRLHASLLRKRRPNLQSQMEEVPVQKSSSTESKNQRATQAVATHGAVAKEKVNEINIRNRQAKIPPLAA